MSICIFRRRPLALALAPSPAPVSSSGPQFVFTGPGSKSVFTGPGPKFFLTGPGRSEPGLAYTSLVPWICFYWPWPTIFIIVL